MKTLKELLQGDLGLLIEQEGLESIITQLKYTNVDNTIKPMDEEYLKAVIENEGYLDVAVRLQLLLSDDSWYPRTLIEEYLYSILRHKANRNSIARDSISLAKLIKLTDFEDPKAIRKAIEDKCKILADKYNINNVKTRDSITLLRTTEFDTTLIDNWDELSPMERFKQALKISNLEKNQLPNLSQLNSN